MFLVHCPTGSNSLERNFQWLVNQCSYQIWGMTAECFSCPRLLAGMWSSCMLFECGTLSKPSTLSRKYPVSSTLFSAAEQVLRFRRWISALGHGYLRLITAPHSRSPFSECSYQSNPNNEGNKRSKASFRCRITS